MRLVMCALSVSAFAPRALADDLDVLRGAIPVAPALFTRWSGFYFGGQVGYSNALADFSGATEPLLAYSLRELYLENEDNASSWPVLGNASASGISFGGFAGYNTQWQDLILGIEADYTQTSFSSMAASASPIARQVTAGSYLDNVNITGSGSLRIDDYASLRARAGYVLGNFLPYGFAGFALGWGNYAITSLVEGQQSTTTVPCNAALSPTTCVDFSYANSAGKNLAMLYGFTAGGGIDIALTPNVFVRGEFEYAQFAPISGIVAEIMTARVGAGLKF
jgi:opacity protein-like surface antigen